MKRSTGLGVFSHSITPLSDQPRRLQIRQPEGVRHQLVAGKESTLLCISSDANPPPTSIHWFFHLNAEGEPLMFTGETIINETYELL